MDALVKQMISLVAELHGLADKLETDAKDVAARASKQKAAAADHDALQKKITDAQTKLAKLTTDIAQFENAKSSLKELVSKL